MLYYSEKPVVLQPQWICCDSIHTKRDNTFILGYTHTCGIFVRVLHICHNDFDSLRAFRLLCSAVGFNLHIQSTISWSNDTQQHAIYVYIYLNYVLDEGPGTMHKQCNRDQRHSRGQTWRFMFSSYKTHRPAQKVYGIKCADFLLHKHRAKYIILAHTTFIWQYSFGQFSSLILAICSRNNSIISSPMRWSIAAVV